MSMMIGGCVKKKKKGITSIKFSTRVATRRVGWNAPMVVGFGLEWLEKRIS